MAKKTGAGDKPQEYDSETGRYGSDGSSAEYDNLPSANRIVNNYEQRFGSVKKVELTSSEWKRYYDTIGNMKAGTVREYKTKDGKRWVILNANELQGGSRTPPRVIIDNGSYISPKVSSIMTFETDDEMYDFIND